MDDLFGKIATPNGNLTMDELMQDLSADEAKRVLVPMPVAPVHSTAMYGHKISAGFPSPADDNVEDKLDLNLLLIHNMAATFAYLSELLAISDNFFLVVLNSDCFVSSHFGMT